MTTDPASLSLNDLMHEFRSGAKLTGTAYNLGQSPERFKRSAERATRLTRMQALGAELRARRAVEAFRELMADGDLDIRGWAAAQSMSVLPDLADATLSGLLVGRSGPEILDLIRRARSKPPEDPPLSSMTTDALVSRFEDACEREYATRFVGDGDSPQDVRLRNRIVGEIIDIRNELQKRDALARLMALLDSDNITVRAEAARATLDVAPNRALKVLEDVVASYDNYETPFASMAINRFKYGTDIPGGASEP